VYCFNAKIYRIPSNCFVENPVQAAREQIFKAIRYDMQVKQVHVISAVAAVACMDNI
jgi:hypothetical protein